MEWTSSAISIYFFPRGSVPSDVLGSSPNPSSWGTPMAVFSGGCDMGTAFTNQQIVSIPMPLRVLPSSDALISMRAMLTPLSRCSIRLSAATGLVKSGVAAPVRSLPVRALVRTSWLTTHRLSMRHTGLSMGSKSTRATATRPLHLPPQRLLLLRLLPRFRCPQVGVANPHNSLPSRQRLLQLPHRVAVLSQRSVACRAGLLHLGRGSRLLHQRLPLLNPRLSPNSVADRSGQRRRLGVATRLGRVEAGPRPRMRTGALLLVDLSMEAGARERQMRREFIRGIWLSI